MIPLLIVRHAPTEWNAQGRIQGRTDVPLSETGRQLAASWRLPAGWEAADCVASPVLRTMETARLLGFDPVPEPALIEMSWGDWEGQRLADIRAAGGEAVAANEAACLDLRPPGGESPRDVQARLLPWLAGLRGPTVAVSHKGVLRALYALATGWTMTGKPPQKLLPFAAQAFRVDGSRVKVQELNIALGPSR